MIRVGVVGAIGKMGRVVCAAVSDDPREPFAIGMLVAIKAVGARPGLTYGLGPLIELDGA